MGIARRCAELLSRGRTFRRTIRVEGRKVQLYVSPDSQLKYMKLGSNAFDRDLITIAERCLSKGSCVWDVGANVGVFTFAAAAVISTGTVVSVEADIWLAELLQKSRRLKCNQSRDIRILPSAASDVDGLTEFHIASRGRASNALAVAGEGPQMGGVRERHHVPTLRLDTVLKYMPRPDFVKVDVEGAELLVLEGATEMIAQVRPVFYIEVGKKNFTKAKAVFCDQEYVTFDPNGRIVDEPSAENYFFAPKENEEMLARISALSNQLGA